MNTQVVNQRKENIMDEKAEKIMELAKKLETEDEYICQDNRDLLELEQRYEKLDIPYQVRRVIDDYIACMRTRDEPAVLYGKILTISSIQRETA